MASCLVRHVNFSRDIRRHLFLDSGQIIDEHLGIAILMDMHWFSIPEPILTSWKLGSRVLFIPDICIKSSGTALPWALTNIIFPTDWTITTTRMTIRFGSNAGMPLEINVQSSHDCVASNMMRQS